MLKVRIVVGLGGVCDERESNRSFHGAGKVLIIDLVTSPMSALNLCTFSVNMLSLFNRE